MIAEIQSAAKVPATRRPIPSTSSSSSKKEGSNGGEHASPDRIPADTSAKSCSIGALPSTRVGDISAWRPYVVYLGLPESLPMALSVSSSIHLLFSFPCFVQ